MTREDLLKTVETYNDAVNIAFEWAATFHHISEPATSALLIDDDGALLLEFWSSTSDGWDGHELERGTAPIPWEFMALKTKAARTKMIATEKEERAARSREASRLAAEQYAQVMAARELQLYRALHAKYSGPVSHK